MKKGKTYALLAAAGVYNDSGNTPLHCTGNDLRIMEDALIRGLKLNKDCIRILGEEDGTVAVRSFARSILEFGELLQEQDTFIFYFSGHGIEQSLCFSDGNITLDSIVEYISRLPAGQKIVILDCCYAGQAKAKENGSFFPEESLAAFAGKGIAVMASSAGDHVSWINEDGSCSIYTEMAAAAILSRRLIRKGQISLPDINMEIRYLAGEWNRLHPEKSQDPVYRSSMVGTICFDVEEFHPYVPQQLYVETDRFIIHHVKPLNTLNQKRLAVFVILKGEDDSIIPEVTRKIIPYVRYSDVYASEQSENRFRGKPVDVVWCYFGHDETDLIRGNHFAYSIWTEDEKLRDVYCKLNRNSEIYGDVFVSWNTSYHMIREIQESDTPEEKILTDYRMLSNRMIKGAEVFIRDLEEAENQRIPLVTLKAAHQNWIRQIRTLYYRLTDCDVVPIQYQSWAEAVLEMAGWIVDMALWLEKGSSENNGEEWLIRQSIRRYYQAINKLRLEEEKKRFGKND